MMKLIYYFRLSFLGIALCLGTQIVFGQISKNIMTRPTKKPTTLSPLAVKHRAMMLQHGQQMEQMREKRQRAVKARLNSQKASKTVKVSSVTKPRLPNSANSITVNSTNDADWDQAHHPTTPQTTTGDITLRSAISFSNWSFSTDTIFVPPGDFQLTLGGLLVSVPFVIKGTGEDQTIIDGGGTDRVFYLEPSGNFVMSGLTVTNGYADNDSGGGMYIQSGKVELDSVAIVGNLADEDGGGIEADGGTLTMNYCRVSSNTAGESYTYPGGGIEVSGDTTFTMNYCCMDLNASGIGGAIYIDQCGSSTIDHSIFKHNTSQVYGGAFCIDYTDTGRIVITNSVIDSNNAIIDGGAIHSGSKNSLTMMNDSVRWNTAQDGAGIIIADKADTLLNVMVYGNSGVYGSGIYLDGGVTSYYLSNVNVVGNTSVGGDGGGIYIMSYMYGSVHFSNVNVDSNTAGGNGGGVYDGNGKLVWIGGSLSHNTATGGGEGGGMYFNPFFHANDTLYFVRFDNNTPDDIFNATGGRYQIVTKTRTLSATHVTRTSATLNGLVRPDGESLNVEFQYGTASGVYTNEVAASPGTVSGTGSDSVSAALSGLTPGIVYYYRVIAFTGSPADTFAYDEGSFMTISTASGNALKFDGSVDYVQIDDNSSLDLTNAMTVEAWIKSTSTSGGFILDKSDYAYYFGINIDGNVGHVSIYLTGINDKTGGWLYSNYMTVNDGKWHHVAATYDGYYENLYVDGALDTSLEVSGIGPIGTNGDALYIGALDGGADFDGFIDEVRLWKVARTQTEIQSTMYETLTGTEPGLVAYWQLNESGNNRTAYEEVGGCDGILHNFTFDGTTNGWLPANDLSLPVQAADFLAKADIGSVTLSWKTQSEVNNAGFNVLRQNISDVGSRIADWEPIANFKTDDALKGHGTSSTGYSYQFVDTKVKSGATYDYKIQSVSIDGTTKDVSTLTGITVDMPTAYSLYQNYPNPFNPSTTIRFDLKQQSMVTLEIYNVLGQKVESWNYGMMDAGRYNEVVGMARFASGVYYYKINAIGNDGQRFVSIKKAVLMK